MNHIADGEVEGRRDFSARTLSLVLAARLHSRSSAYGVSLLLNSLFGVVSEEPAR